MIDVVEAGRTPVGRMGEGSMQVEGAPGALVVIISGPSGVGKDTIIDAMRERDPGRTDRHYVIATTTRGRRDYSGTASTTCSRTQEEFRRLRETDGLLEYAEVHGNWYGTPRDQVVDAVTAGRDTILKIDVQGARAVRTLIPDALLIFVVPPVIGSCGRASWRGPRRRPRRSSGGCGTRKRSSPARPTQPCRGQRDRPGAGHRDRHRRHHRGGARPSSGAPPARLSRAPIATPRHLVPPRHTAIRIR